MTADSKRWLTAGSWAYFALLFGWLAVYLSTGDRFGYVALINTLAVYYFFPLPLAALAALAVRRLEVWAACALGLAAFAWLWGGQFVPRTSPVHAEGRALTVMTYNILGIHGVPAPVVELIRREDADVVALQEVTPVMAQSIRAQLAEQYPYQILRPDVGVEGAGVISKFPIRPAGERLALAWVGAPQEIVLDWNGQEVTLVNYPMWPVGLGTPGQVSQLTRDREAQARALVEYAGRASGRGPVIAAGDANATELSDAYRILGSGLRDSWREAGFGLGHTFPGAANEESSRLAIGPIAVPMWLVRIDYVFHSDHFQAVDARTAAFDGVSDHRGVVVRLLLVDE